MIAWNLTSTLNHAKPRIVSARSGAEDTTTLPLHSLRDLRQIGAAMVTITTTTDHRPSVAMTADKVTMAAAVEAVGTATTMVDVADTGITETVDKAGGLSEAICGRLGVIVARLGERRQSCLSLAPRRMEMKDLLSQTCFCGFALRFGPKNVFPSEE
jgi:hypothetical protein